MPLAELKRAIADLDRYHRHDVDCAPGRWIARVGVRALATAHDDAATVARVGAATAVEAKAHHSPRARRIR